MSADRFTAPGRQILVWVGLVAVAALIGALTAYQSKPSFVALPTATATATATIPPTATATSNPTPTATATRSPTPTATAANSPTPTATATSSPSPTAVPTDTVELAEEATATLSATVAAQTGAPVSGLVVGSPWPTPDASTAEDHYWLGRPTGPGTTQWASPFYPYGSTGQGRYLLHHGADIPNPLGTPLLAPADGVVVFAEADSQVAVGPDTDFYGNTVIIELDRQYLGQPVYVLLGHMQTILVTKGQEVKRGQVVGEVGMTGVALGPHVHVEVRVGENSYTHTRNAEFWLETLAGHGTLAGRILTEDGRHLPELTLLLYPGPSFSSPQYYAYAYADAPGLINPDDQWGENFLLSDLPAGAYKVEIDVGGQVIYQEMVIEPGQTTWLELQIPG